MNSDPAEVDEEDEDNAEPKMYVAVGTRRTSALEIRPLQNSTDSNLSKTSNSSSGHPSGHTTDHASDGSTANSSDNNRPQGIQRRESSRRVKLIPPPIVTTDAHVNSTSVAAGNFMQNIHSSPVQATLTYTPPIYPKSSRDEEFISVSLQRNFVFANALSEEEVSRKREMKQIVDAFESYSVPQSGVTILSAGEVGDYFYILKEGCVEYRNTDPNNGVSKVVRMAQRPGQSFGELCLLYDCPPPADCVSGPPRGGTTQPSDGNACNLWRIHKVTFRQILALRTMRRDERMRDAIRKIKALKELDGEFINRIADALEVREVEKGEVVYEVGQKADEFYVVGSDGGVMWSSVGGKSVIIGPGEAFGEEAIAKKSVVRADSAVAIHHTTLLFMSRDHLNKVIGSLQDAIQLSQDRRLLKSVPLFRDSDFEDFEYELLAALIEKVHFKGGKEVSCEEEIVEEPALYIVHEGILDQICDKYPDREKVLRPGDYFGEASLTPDKNMRFGGAKGGNKYHEETVEVVSDTAVCGKLTLSNIDSVILDLHRLGCKRKGGVLKKGIKKVGSSDEADAEPRPESLDDLEYHQLFGAGTFGRVWIVSRPNGKTAYALKIQSKRELLDQRQASSAARERSVMAKLDHPFVCKLVNTFQDNACIYMLLQLVQGGELLNLIQGGEMYGGLPESAAKFYAAGILEGLTYMHRRHIIYRDLKPENVLLDSDGYAVIVDLGFAKVVNDKTYTFCGTPLYLAPEIVLSRGHDRAVDYWSLGCLIYEMLFASTPFYERGIDQKGLFKNIVRGKWKLPDSSKLSKHAIDLIYGMLQRKPTERLGCLAGGYRDIKHHPWMQEVNFVKLVKKQIKAPWTPQISDPLDISNFENFESDGKDFTRGKKPLTAEEQLVFQDF